MEGWLEARYERYNRRRYVHPDPLACLYRYPATADREIAALVAASLAYGQVGQIIKSVEDVLGRMGGSPRAYLAEREPGRIKGDMAGFVHRFARAEHICALLMGIREVVFEHGSLLNCFAAHLSGSDRTVFPALCRFSGALRRHQDPGHLLACPEKGSACKRLNLYLRWMVRCDRVDPGGWEGVSAARLIVPLDVHMFRICSFLGLTRRRQADMKTALEITDAFRRWSPQDPVRYDFALSRMGIRKEISGDLKQW